jgi:HSP20 family protein
MAILSKRLLITLVAVPFLLNATNIVSSKVQKPCEMGCPFWGMEELESFFNRPFPRMNSMTANSSLKEVEKAYVINIDLPGMDKKDISIETTGNRITISGERKEDSTKKEVLKHSYRQFQQSYLLPDDADFNAISATSLNGVLKITVPKIAGKLTSKKVEIK